MIDKITFNMMMLQINKVLFKNGVKIINSKGISIKKCDLVSLSDADISYLHQVSCRDSPPLEVKL
ncbi:MAG: hypothetical protein PHG24_01580 [Candidatus Pacebacteria bacterium]|nr:hypothetical protein [Candidatus Paceibacterota bacterium]